MTQNLRMGSSLSENCWWGHMGSSPKLGSLLGGPFL